jgi:hypothetical protein
MDICPGKALDVAYSFYKRHHAPKPPKGKDLEGKDFEGEEWKQYPDGQRGDVDVIVTTSVRGDRSKAKRGNKNIRPGPHDTDIIEKMCPAVLVNAEGTDSLFYKVLTTFTNRDLDTKEMRQNIKDNHVTIHQTGHDDPTKARPSFGSLEFTSNNETYLFKTPCFMPIVNLVSVPKHSRRLRLGRLTGMRDFKTLDDILEEECSRNISADRRSVRDHGPIDPTDPNSSAPTRYQPPSALPGSPTFPPQSREVDNLRIPVEANDADILEYIKQNGLPAEYVEGIKLVAEKRAERERSEESKKGETTERSEEGKNDDATAGSEEGEIHG